MYIDRFKNGESGTYIDDTGCHYENAEDFYQTSVFGFCGCGRPEDNLQFILDGLKHILSSDREDYDTWLQDGLRIFGNEESRQFFFYWADKQGLTEHGGAIPGWLTEEGEAVMSDLMEITAVPGSESNG